MDKKQYEDAMNLAKHFQESGAALFAEEAELTRKASLINDYIVAPSLAKVDFRDYTRADYQYEVIIKCIKDFQEGLDSDTEVAVQMASYGHPVMMNVNSIEYANPSIIIFRGYIKEQASTLIQHINQLNFVLMAVKKQEPNKPARRIGFISVPEEE